MTLKYMLLVFKWESSRRKSKSHHAGHTWYNIPVEAGLLPGESHQVALLGDDGDLVDGVQDQVENAFFLEQVLAVPQGS